MTEEVIEHHPLSMSVSLFLTLCSVPICWVRGRARVRLVECRSRTLVFGIEIVAAWVPDLFVEIAWILIGKEVCRVISEADAFCNFNSIERITYLLEPQSWNLLVNLWT